MSNISIFDSSAPPPIDGPETFIPTLLGIEGPLILTSNDGIFTLKLPNIYNK